MSKAKRKKKRTAAPPATGAEDSTSTTGTAVPAAPAVPSARRLPGLSILLVLLAALLPFLNSLDNGFVPHDPVDVVSPYVRGPSAPGYFFTGDFWEKHNQGRSTRYQPLVLVSFALNHRLGMLTPFGCHLTSLLLHLGVCLLLLLVLRRILPRGMLALTAALLFAVYPLHTEPVAAVGGRAELLSALFFLAAWLAHLTAWLPEEEGWWHWRHRAGMTLTGMVLYALSLFSAGSAVALLPAVLLGDLLRFRSAPPEPAGDNEDDFFTPNRQSANQVFRSVTRRFSPLPGAGYAGLLAVLAGYLALRNQVLGSLSGGADVPFLDNPLAWEGVPVRLMTAVKVLGEYLWLQLWPILLSADYSFNPVKRATSPADPGFLAALVCCLALLVGAVLLWRTRQGRIPAFAILFFFCTIAPVSNIAFPIDTIMAERLLYIPSLGFCLALAWLLGLPPRPSRRWMMVGLALLIALGFTARTVTRNLDWRDAQTLLLSAAAVSPDSARVHGDLGAGYLKRGEYDLAARSLERALEIMPEYPIALYMLGRSRIELGELEGAREVLVRVAELRPAHPEILLALGAVDFRLGNLEEATTFFRQTLILDPGNRWAMESLGISLSQSGLHDEAIEVFRTCLDHQPGSVTIHFHLATALVSAGRLEQAESSFRAALEIDPGHQSSLLGLADICRRTNRAEESAELRARALGETG